MTYLPGDNYPAYHLRPNKAIDRLLFFEALRAIDVCLGIRKHSYIGFGGPFLEEFRHLAKDFPTLSLYSVEQDELTFKRQKFHLCSRKLKLFHGTLGNFLSDEQFPSGPLILWADYTGFKRETLLDLDSIVRTAEPNSIIRITVKAESPIYTDSELNIKRGKTMIPAGKKQQFEKFVDNYITRHNVSASFPNEWFDAKSFLGTGYATLLCRMLDAVVHHAAGLDRGVIPLRSSVYSDGTLMTSYTALICEGDKIKDTRKKLGSVYKLPKSNEIEMEHINIPVLSTKERLRIEDLLPRRKGLGNQITKRLGYDIDSKEHEEKSQQYAEFHRLYPHFGKIVP